MNMVLSPETQQLLEQRMRDGNDASADETVRIALQRSEDSGEEALEELDAETLAAIAEGEAEADRGEGRPVAEVRQEFHARFGI